MKPDILRKPCNLFRNSIVSFLVIFILLGSIFASGCISGSTSSVEAPESAGNQSDVTTSTSAVKDTLIIGDAFSLNDLDPANSANSLWNWRVGECLVEVDPDGSLSPGLAKSWENVNGTSWIFHLREDVKFHDGKKMTAYDVKYSLDRSMNRSASNVVTLAIKQCNVIDEYTVELVTENTDASIPGRMSGPRAIIYSNTSVTDEKGVITKLVTTGPFKIISRDAATDKLTLDRFDEYYNGTGRLAHVIITFNMANENSREMAIENGDVDITVEPSIASTSRLKKNSDLNVYVYDWHGQFMLKFGNLTRAPYDDTRVRKALAYALDRENIVNSILLDRGIVNKGNGVPSVAKWCNSGVTGYSYNVSKAKELLKEAGWTDTDGDGIVDKDGRAFKINFYTSTDNPAQTVMAPAIQSQLLNIGIGSDIQVLDYSAINAHTQDWGFLQLTYTVPLIVNDPSYFLENNFKTGGSSNIMNYSNQSLDKLLTEARSELNETRRYELYRQAQKIVTDDDCVHVYFASSRYCLITRSDLKGYVPYVVTHNWRLNKDMYFE